VAILDRRLARLLRPEKTPLVIAAAKDASPHFAHLLRLDRVATLPQEVAGLSQVELHQRVLRAASELIHQGGSQASTGPELAGADEL
jgi:hypothetical protein